MTELCPCIYPDLDPDAEDPMTELCACGHVLDEHADDGTCQVELTERS